MKNDLTGSIVQMGSTPAATQAFYAPTTAGSPMPAQATCMDVSGTAPNVNGLGFVRKTDTTHLNNMAHGTPGQRVSVLFTGLTPVSDNAYMFLNGAASRNAQPNEIIAFKNYNGAWYEEGGGRPIFNGLANWPAGSIASGSAVFTTIAVAGANVDDFASASLSINPGDVIVTAQVISTGMVRVGVANLTGVTITFPLFTVFVKVNAKD